MKIIKAFLILLIITIPLTGFSEITVTYKSGECNIDLMGDGKWENALVDMELDEKSVIKTGSDGEIELEIEGETVAIGRDTIVSVNYIVTNVQQKKKMTWFKSLSNVFNNIIGTGEEQTKTALLGVRAKPAEEEELGWMGEMEEEDPITKFQGAKELYEEGNYTQAINIFKDILDEEELSDMREEIAFYLGSSLFNNVQYEEAIKYLGGSLQDKEAYYYEVALINYSFAHYFSDNYSKAIDGFKAYTEEFMEGELKPYALLMMVKSYKVLGKKEEAKRYFSEIERKYSNTEVYNDALQEMKGL